MTRLLVFLLLVPMAMALPGYDVVLDALVTGDAVEFVDGMLWAPWYSSSSSCELKDLHRDASCNIGVVNRTQHCMVTDEFSQLGVLVAMGSDEQLMRAFLRTVDAIATPNGLPSWRVVRNGTTIIPCDTRVNKNCDTASDADARVILALSTAAENPAFTDTTYRTRADELTAKFVQHEIVRECHPSPYGEICFWLAAGTHAARGGLASTDFGYAGYYPDAILALLHACPHNPMYCDVAEDLVLNYLLAAEYDGTFRVPPGRSFRWTNLSGTPRAECTNTCSPVQWDASDAPRAMTICAVLPKARELGLALPELSSYCDAFAELMQTPWEAPIQFAPDGSFERTRSDVFAQGLQAMLLSGVDQELASRTLAHAMEHYSEETRTMDYHSCFGIYESAYALRVLGQRELPELVEEVVTTETASEEPSLIEKITEILDVSFTFSPVAKYLSLTLSSLMQPHAYTITCDASGMMPDQYTWYFGDGTFALTEEPSITHVFPEAGTYVTRCVARNATSTWATTQTITVA